MTDQATIELAAAFGFIREKEGARKKSGSDVSDYDGRVVKAGQSLKLALESGTPVAERGVGVLLGLALDGDPLLEANDGVVTGRQRLQLRAGEAVGLLLPSVDGDHRYGALRRHCSISCRRVKRRCWEFLRMICGTSSR